MNKQDKNFLEESDEKIVKNNEHIELAKQKDSNKIQKKNKIIIIILSIVLLLVLCVIIIAKVFIFTPKNIFLYALNNSYNNLNNKITLNDNFDLFKKKTMTSDVNLQINYLTGNNLFDYILDNTGINNLDLSVKNEIDINNQIFNNQLNLISGEDKISVELYENKDLMYLYLNDIFDKYIEFSTENTNDNIDKYNWLLALTSIDKDKLNYFFTQVKDNYLAKIDNKDFKMTKEKQTVNDENVKANKISYTITQVKFNSILKDIFKKLEEDTTITNDEELRLLLDYLKNIVDKNGESSNKKLVLSVYTIGLMQDPIKYSFESVGDSDTYIVNYSDYANVFYIDLGTNKNKNLIVSLRNINKQQFKLNIEIPDYKLDTTINIVNDETKIDYKLDYLDNSLSGSFEIDQNENNDNYSKGNLNWSLTLNENSKDVLKLKINGDYENRYNEEISVVDVSNSVNKDDLSEEEISDITTKLTNNAIFIKVYAAYLSYQVQNK